MPTYEAAMNYVAELDASIADIRRLVMRAEQEDRLF